MPKKRRAQGEGSLVERKDGRWQGIVSLGHDRNGNRVRRSVYGRTQAEALEKLEQLKRHHALGTLASTTLTVSEHLADWLADKAKGVKPRTAELYGDLIRLHLEPRLGRHKLAKLAPLHVRRAITDISEAVGIPTANKCRRVLYGALKAAVRWQLIPRNPVEAVDPIKEEEKELELWTPEQAARFLDTAAGHRLYAVFYTAMSCGLRRGEVLGLKWADLDGDQLTIRRSLTFRGGKPAWSTPKTNRGRRVLTVPSDALAVLEAHRAAQEAERAEAGALYADEGLVFADQLGAIVTPAAMQYHWAKLQGRAGVPYRRFHDLRHLYVSLLVRQGLDPRSIADRVGHSDPAFTLRRYSHLFESQRRAAAVPLQTLLRGPKGDRN